jgi:hypothetical protein
MSSSKEELNNKEVAPPPPPGFEDVKAGAHLDEVAEVAEKLAKGENLGTKKEGTVDAPDLSLKTGKLNWAEEVSLFDWKRKTMMGLLFCGGFSSFTPSRSRLLLLLLFFIAREVRPWEIPIGLHFSSRKISERRSGALMSIEEDARNSIEIILYFKSLTLSFFLSFFRIG